MKSSSAIRWALGMILAVALGLRLWGSTFGIPREYAADEWKKVIDAYHYRDSGFHHVKYQPSLLYHSLYVLFSVTDPIKPAFERWISNRFVSPPQFQPYGHLVWVGRCWMALLSTLTVFVVFVLGRRLKDESAGLAGAALYAVCPLPVFAAHYIKEDTPLALMTAIAVVLALRLQENGRWRDYIFAGLGCALAFSAKFPGAATLVLGIAAALLVAPSRLPQSESDQPLATPSQKDNVQVTAPRKAWINKAMGILLIVVCFLAGFAILCPVFVYHLAEAWDGIAFQTRYVLTGHFDFISISPVEEFFSFHLRKSLVPGMTVFPLLAALAGLALLIRKKPRAGALMAIWTIGYYLMIESAKAKPYPFFARYILPVVPALCALASVAAAYAIGLLLALAKIAQANLAAQRRIISSRFQLSSAPEDAANAKLLDQQFKQLSATQRRNMRLRMVLTVALALILLPPSYLTLRRVSAIIPDTRDAAQEWIEKNAPKGATILATPYGPYLDEGVFRVAPFSKENLRKYRTERFRSSAAGIGGAGSIGGESSSADAKTSASVYCVLSSIFYQRYLENPGKVPMMTVTFSQILEEEKPVIRFSSPAGPYGFNNPDILIYRF